MFWIAHKGLLWHGSGGFARGVHSKITISPTTGGVGPPPLAAGMTLDVQGGYRAMCGRSSLSVCTFEKVDLRNPPVRKLAKSSCASSSGSIRMVSSGLISFPLAFASLWSVTLLSAVSGDGLCHLNPRLGERFFAIPNNSNTHTSFGAWSPWRLLPCSRARETCRQGVVLFARSCACMRSVDSPPPRPGACV